MFGFLRMSGHSRVHSTNICHNTDLLQIFIWEVTFLRCRSVHCSRFFTKSSKNLEEKASKYQKKAPKHYIGNSRLKSRSKLWMYEISIERLKTIKEPGAFSASFLNTFLYFLTQCHVLSHNHSNFMDTTQILWNNIFNKD